LLPFAPPVEIELYFCNDNKTIIVIAGMLFLCFLLLDLNGSKQIFHFAWQSHKFIRNGNLNLIIASDIAAALSGKNNTTG
jgi:hypothetical protein